MTLLLDRLSVYGEAVAIALSTIGERAIPEHTLRTSMWPFAEGHEPVRDLMLYLRELGLIEADERGGSIRATIDPTEDDLRLRILAWLRAARDENGVILDLYDWLLREGDLSGRVLERDEVWPLYNQARQRRAGHEAVGVVMNSPKMGSWLRLMTYVGLARPERSNTFVLAPAPETFRRLLATASKALGGGDLSLVATLAWIERSYCPVLSRPDCLQRGFADALELLELLGEVRLGVLGDAAAVHVNRRQVSQIALTSAMEG
jgi:hypothetical protein